ncbi:MAG: tyrosine-type recombinase/integrase [Pseudonocardiaceae bacterium]
MPRKREQGTRAPNGASTIYHGKDGRWHGRVTVGVRDDGTPDRRHIERKTEAEVIRAVRNMERERDSGKVRRPGRVWTVEQWLTHWVENIAASAVRPNTLTGYRVAVYNHLIPGIGAHRIDRLQPEHLERLYLDLGKKRSFRNTEFKPARIHQIHRTVRTALGEALRRGHVTSNPAEIARPPRIPEEEIMPFTMEEARQILNAAGPTRNGARFVVALTLGLRKGEALGLKWRDVDFSRRTLTIRRTVQRMNWKHGCAPDEPCGHRYAGHCPQRHGGGVVAAEVKSGAGKRTIGLPLPLVEVLKEHQIRQQRDRERARNLWADEGWVFANRLGGPVHPRIDHDAWKSLLKKAGVRDARLHDARHTAATMLLLLGVPDRAVMDVMGWAQVTMTKRYQHITTELTTMIADQVGGLYWSDDDRSDVGDDDGAA